MTRHLQSVAAPGFSVSATSGSGIKGAIAQPTKFFAMGKSQKCELYGRLYPSSDAAFKAMNARGYTEIFYPRTSVPSPLFASLPHVRNECKFDALYRYWKWMMRQSGGGWGYCAMQVEIKLHRLAKSVGIFHPATKRFLKGEI